MEPRKIIAVLAVDDEKLNADLFQRVFRGKADFKLMTVTSPDEALDVLRDNAVDLMLVDQSMPSMSGLGLIQVVRQRGYNPVCIMVTAYPEMKEVLSAWDEGLIRYIVPKPWRAADLMKTVDRAISRLA